MIAQKRSYRPMPPNPEYLMWHRAQVVKKAKTPAASTREKMPNIEPVKAPAPTRGLWVGLGVTGTYYYGDLNYEPDQGVFQSSHIAFNPGLHATFRRNSRKMLFPVVNVGYGKFVSQNDNLQPVSYRLGEIDTLITPNNYAETVFLYADFNLRLRLLPSSSLFQPYISAGVGGLMFFPRAQDGILLFRKKSTRAPDEDAYGTLTYSFPLSGGFEYYLNPQVSINLAYIFRFSGTDYLDNIDFLGTHDRNDQLHMLTLGVNLKAK